MAWCLGFVRGAHDMCKWTLLSCFVDAEIELWLSGDLACSVAHLVFLSNGSWQNLVEIVKSLFMLLDGVVSAWTFLLHCSHPMVAFIVSSMSPAVKCCGMSNLLVLAVLPYLFLLPDLAHLTFSFVCLPQSQVHVKLPGISTLCTKGKQKVMSKSQHVSSLSVVIQNVIVTHATFCMHST